MLTWLIYCNIYHVVKQAIKKLREYQALQRTAIATLDELSHQLDKDFDYFREQWERQRVCQLEIISNQNIKKLEEKFEQLQTVEDEKVDCE